MSKKKHRSSYIVKIGDLVWTVALRRKSDTGILHEPNIGFITFNNQHNAYYYVAIMAFGEYRGVEEICRTLDKAINTIIEQFEIYEQEMRPLDENFDGIYKH